MNRLESLKDIPDLVPAGLLIPAERHDLRVPKIQAETATSTTPLEVGYVLFETPYWLNAYRTRLQIHHSKGELPENFLDSSWMNHTGRAVVRAALDPDREANIDMFEVYLHERNLTAVYPSSNEEGYFLQWVENNGVFKR